MWVLGFRVRSDAAPLRNRWKVFKNINARKIILITDCYWVVAVPKVEGFWV